MTYTVVKEGIGARGNIAHFEGRLRHYTDRIESSEPGEFRLVRAPHPVRMTFGVLAGALATAVASAWLIRKIFPVGFATVLVMLRGEYTGK